MQRLQRQQTATGLVLGAACLGLGLFLSGLAATLQLGEASTKGFLLVPDLPKPLYIAMAIVLTACVSITLLNSVLRRRQQHEPPPPRHSEAIRPPWYAPALAILNTLLIVGALIWLLRQGSPLRETLHRWQLEWGNLQAALRDAPHTLIHQVQSPTAGYALFVVVMIIYGGLALLGLWVLFDQQGRLTAEAATEPEQIRRARRAVTASLHALHQHHDPRQAIIACYARLEHILEDHGVPADEALTPQEYMGIALNGLTIPSDALVNLVELFEIARYSLHPLDENAKQSATAYLEAIQSQLERESALATQP